MVGVLIYALCLRKRSTSFEMPHNMFNPSPTMDSIDRANERALEQWAREAQPDAEDEEDEEDDFDRQLAQFANSADEAQEQDNLL